MKVSSPAQFIKILVRSNVKHVIYMRVSRKWSPLNIYEKTSRQSIPGNIDDDTP